MTMSRRIKKPGLPPGSIIYTGSKNVEKVIVHYTKYNGTDITQELYDNHKEHVYHQSSDEYVDWYDFRGVNDSKLIELFGNTFSIHPLILEDVVDVHQRPKYEEYEKGNFMSIRFLKFDKSLGKITSEQVTLYFRIGFVVSFQERESDLLSAVRQRILSGKGRIRHKGADYLAYSIIDMIVDNYYVVLDEIEETIEVLEDNLMESQDVKSKGDIHKLRKEILVLRKSVSPLREAIGRFSRSESEFVDNSSLVFIRDLYGHTIQIIDSVDTFRDVLNGLQDLFITEVSFKMNQVMQVLTLVSTIFIPLTFLAGIYGMNFENIPELKLKYGYFYLLGLMLVILFFLLMYFRKKKWL